MLSSKVINFANRHPRLSDAVSGTLHKATGGLWKKGKWRTAQALAERVQPHDRLHFRAGKVYINNAIEPVFHDPQLFGRAVIEDVEVTDEMATFAGMNKYLGWEVVSNMPSVAASLLAFIGDAVLFGLDCKIFYFSDLKPTFTLHLLHAFFILPLYLPFHRLDQIDFFMGLGKDKVRLSEVGSAVKNCLVKKYFVNTGTGNYHFWQIPGVIFIQDEHKGIDWIEAHETAHDLGASEFRAFSLGFESFVKRAFQGESPKVGSALLLFQTAMHNFFRIMYIFRSYSNKSLNRIAAFPCDREQLARCVSRFENGELNLTPYEAALAYQLLKTYDKALEYLYKLTEEKNRIIQAESWFAIARIQHDQLHDHLAATESYAKVIALARQSSRAREKGELDILAQAARQELEKLKLS